MSILVYHGSIIQSESKLALAVAALAYDFYSRFLITAAVNSEVVDEPVRGISSRQEEEAINNLPPISAVLTLPALRTWKVADAILFAM